MCLAWAASSRLAAKRYKEQAPRRAAFLRRIIFTIREKDFQAIGEIADI